MFQAVSASSDNNFRFDNTKEIKHKQRVSATTLNNKRANITIGKMRLSTHSEATNGEYDGEFVDIDHLIEAILSMNDVPVTPVYDTRQEVRQKASR